MASLRNHCRFAIFAAVGSAHILKQAFDFLAVGSGGAASARSHVIDAAVILLVLHTLVAYLAGVTLVHVLCTAPPSGTRLSPEDSRRLAALAVWLGFTLVVLSALPLVLFLFVNAGK